MQWGIYAVIALIVLFKRFEKTVGEANFKADFYARITKEASSVSRETGIPLSIIATQAAHESSFGRSGLARKSNNLFGIKAGSTWTGAKDSWKTTEIVNGKSVQVEAFFRKYADWGESVRDWYQFLKKTRYAKALYFAKLGDATNFFTELQKAGYATDPRYSDKLVGVYNVVKEAVV